MERELNETKKKLREKGNYFYPGKCTFVVPFEPIYRNRNRYVEYKDHNSNF